MRVGAGIVVPREGPDRGGSPVNTPGLGPSGLVSGILLGLVLVTGLVLVAVARRRQRTAVQLEAAQAMADAAVGSQFASVLAVTPSEPPAPDANIPRWRRPSLAAARYETDNVRAIRAAEPAAILRTRPARTFREATDLLGERTVVRFGVPLLNRPDEAYGRTLEDLVSGDQVEILEQGAVWTNVITPSGAAGWVPTATLAPTAAANDAGGEDPALALEPRATLQEVEPPSLEMLLEAARRARQEAAVEPDAKPAGRRGRRKSAAAEGRKEGAADDAGPADSEERRPRPRRRPKASSTSRGN
jgi:hypothetical protein